MTTRKYTSRSQQTTLSSAVTSGATVIPVTNASTLFSGTTISAGQTFTIVIDPDTALEEICDVTAASSNNLTVTRAVDMSGASAQDHSSGAVVRHMMIGRDLRESNLHIEATGSYNDGTSAHNLHGLGSSDGVVVGTTATQTLTNKTLTAPVLTGAGVDASIVFEGATADAFETTLTVVDPTQDNTITLPNTSGTVDIINAVQTLTNKTLTTATLGSNLDAGAFKITNLATPTLASDAVRKDFADAQVAAAATSATSAAASATAAATSASSAATSATSAAASVSSIAGYATTASNSAAAAATSATSAAASATAAATSATSAAASATTASASASTATTQAAAAVISAASAATSATAAATSATSAAASATTAANSVATIASYATTASNSASAAATSASSAATSASSAATSASSAATSASSAATTYDEFDDRYLGSKTTAPTVDNDGNTLLVGAIYWNSTDGKMYVWSGTVWVQIATTSVYTAATLGSTVLTSGTTISTVTALTENNLTLTGTLTAGASSGTNGQYLQSTGTGTQWGTVSGYSAPTLGSTSIGSGATVSNVNALTINSTTIPTSATLLTSGGVLGTPTSGTLTNATGLPVSGIVASTTAALGVGSIELGHASDTTLARVSAGVVSIEGVPVVTTTATTTLTNKTISGASNTLTNIANSSLTNSSITLNGTSVSLGGSATIGGGADEQMVVMGAL